MTEEKEIHMEGQDFEDAVGHPLRRSTDVKSFNDINVTVGRLEQSIQSTNNALEGFAARTTNDIDRLTKSIEELTKNQLLGKQTNWGMIASWAGVFIILLGLVVYQPMQEMRSTISEHREDGHPHSVITRIQNNETRFLDITTRIGHQIELLETADKERLKAVDDRIKELEDWIREYSQSNPRAHAMFEENIKSLKESVDHLTEEAHVNVKDVVSLKERILDIEREIYTDAAYRAGRPIKPPLAKQQ